MELIALLICFVVLSYKRHKEKQKILKLMSGSMQDVINTLLFDKKNENPETVDSQDSKTLEK